MKFAGHRYGAIVYFVVCFMFAHNVLNGSDGQEGLEMGQSNDLLEFPRIDQINDSVLEKTIETLWSDLTMNVAQEVGQTVGEFEMGPRYDPGNIEDTIAMVLDKLLSQIDFSDTISPATEYTANMVRNILRTQIIIAFLDRYYKGTLTHCFCVSTPKRIVLALRMVNDILNKFTDGDAPIVLTAFAVGSLFQEYILLKPLIDLGYTNITLNIIDLAYPDPMLLQGLLTRTGKSTLEEALSQYRSDLISNIPDLDINSLYNTWEDDFASLYPDLNKLIKESRDGNQKALDFIKKELPQVTINSFKNIKEYIVQSRKDPQMASDVLSLVDPDLGVFQISAYPYESNLVGLTIPGLKIKYRPYVFIALPEEQPIQIYVQTAAYKLKEVQDLVKKIVAIAHETRANKKYTPKFRNKIIEHFASYSLNALNKQLPKYQELLMDEHLSAAQVDDILEELGGIIAPYGNPAGVGSEAKAEQKRTIKLLNKLINYGLLEGIDIQEKLRTARVAIDKVLVVINTYDPAVTLSWFSDAHLAFQELVRAAKDDPLIYLYYNNYNNLLDLEAPLVFEQVDKKSYSARDVFGPIVGKLLTNIGVYNEDDDSDTDQEIEQGDSDDGSFKIIVVPEELYERVM